VNGGGGRKPNNFSQTLPDQHGDELAVMQSDRQEEDEEGEGEEPAAPPPPRPKRTGARPKRTEPTLDRKVLADH
jgi:hypothetical protein